MSYAATVTFSLKNASSSDYDCIYEELKKAGLSKTVKGKKEHDLPETTVYGKFDGDSVSDVRDEVSEAVDKAFEDCGLSGKFFLAVGGSSHTWGIRYPDN